ncbi:MAG: hypothetical protein BJ554DRAFT_8147 [Olpidium bornovanus]|uniref:Uncharacterized protein n=1 Tax=Olpidium bornovanus TaxID=278681 RepID=A0A8H8DII5_9FUNG|nr:MAG: hypothetical protein BJ554DRAFT_8147 [Olpidium bornovanus]
MPVAAEEAKAAPAPDGGDAGGIQAAAKSVKQAAAAATPPDLPAGSADELVCCVSVQSADKVAQKGRISRNPNRALRRPAQDDRDARGVLGRPPPGARGGVAAGHPARKVGRRRARGQAQRQPVGRRGPGLDPVPAARRRGLRLPGLARVGPGGRLVPQPQVGEQGLPAVPPPVRQGAREGPPAGQGGRRRETGLLLGVVQHERPSARHRRPRLRRRRHQGRHPVRMEARHGKGEVVQRRAGIQTEREPVERRGRRNCASEFPCREARAGAEGRRLESPRVGRDHQREGREGPRHFAGKRRRKWKQAAGP